LLLDCSNIWVSLIEILAVLHRTLRLCWHGLMLIDLWSRQSVQGIAVMACFLSPSRFFLLVEWVVVSEATFLNV